MPLIIPEGMRAVSIRVNDVIGVAGFAIPQTRVDVLLTITPPGGDNPITKIVLQNVPMLALDQTIHRDEEGNPIPATVATVLVTPEDAEKLVHAAAQGSIQMALRNVLDLEAITTDGSRVANLLGTTSGGGGGRGRTVRVPPTTQADTTSGIIEVYRGGVRTLISY
jgi:pilus assembly protein CpaB